MSNGLLVKNIFLNNYRIKRISCLSFKILNIKLLGLRFF